MKLAFAPAVWLAHFGAVYLLLSLVCATAAAERTLFGAAVVPAGVGIATLVAQSVCLITAISTALGCAGQLWMN